MDASKLSDEQFSALELMMNHADEAHISSQGAPRQKRKKKSMAELFPEGFDFVEEYVGTGSRAANREMRAKQAEKAARPNTREVVKALETVFAEQSEDSQDIVKSVNQSTQSTKAVAKTMAEWLKWTKDRAFLEDHKARTDESIGPTSSNRGKRRGSENDSDDSGPDDSAGPDDYVRDRNGRRTKNRRRRPRSRTLRKLQRFGKSRAGKIAGLVALAATGLGIGAYMKSDTSDNLEAGNDNYGEGEKVGENNLTPNSHGENSPNPVNNAEVPRTPATAPEVRKSDSMTDEELDRYEAKRDKQDTTAAVVSTGGMLLAGSRRIPGVGAVVQAGEGIYNANQIANDPTLTDSEKHKAQVKNVTSTGGAATGATIGAWAGGAIGSIVPVFGTAIGATLGGLLGGYLGDMIGDYVGEKITNETDEAVEEDRKRREKEDKENQDSLLNNPIAQKYNPPIFMPIALGGASPTGAAGGFNYGYNGGGPARFPGQTSQRANDIAQKVLGSEKIGGVSEQFESGGRGVGTVSSGAGDYGGVSYGKHQLASANGSMSQFLASKEAQGITGDFSGMTPGTAAFNERYKQVAASRGKEMEDAQYQYLVRTHYAPTAEKLEKNLGIDMDKQGRAFKELVYSTSMQYGGNAADKIQRAFKGKDFNSMTEQERIEAIQQDKLANVQNDFRSSSAAVQQGVAERTQRELAVLKKVHEGDKPKETEKPTEVAKTDATDPMANVPVESRPGDGERTMKASVTDDGKVVTSEVAAPVDKKLAEVAAPVSKEVPFDQKSESDKEATLAKLRDRKDFMERKVAYIKAHPEVTRADDKKVDEAVREQQRQEKVVATEQDGTAVVRSSTINAKEESAPEVPRAKPLEEMPAPEPAPVTETASATPSGGSAQSSGGGARSSNAPTSGSSPSLDDIPVILDDPLLNMINVGYV